MKCKKGFTLIELLVVIAIIGILSSLILVSIASVRNKANVVATRQLMTTLGIACEQYYTDWGGVYPPAYASESPSRNEGIEMLYHALTTREGRSTRDYARDISIDSIDDTDGDDAKEFVDAWGNALVYVNSANYTKKCEYISENGTTYEATPQRDSIDNRWFRPGKFMFWSVGKYGKNENGLGENVSNF